MKENLLKEKSTKFAIRIINLYKYLRDCKKECSETEYWLYLLQQTEYISDEKYESINTDCLEILKLLTATIVKLKNNGNIP